MSETEGKARIVQLKSGQTGPAVFMVPGFGGSVDRLAVLAASLATPMPVFAIEGRGIDGSTLPDTAVETMARHYVAEIRALRGCGPFFLIGHSFGGLVALEIARQFMASGERIACLILLDSNFTNLFWPWRYYLKVLTARLFRRLQEFKATPVHNKAIFLRAMLGLLIRKLNASNVTQSVASDAMAAHQAAFAKYNPGVYSGKIIFFRASLQDYPADAEALWRSRVGVLEIHSATGGHLSMLDPPNATTLAANISACLAAASG